MSPVEPQRADLRTDEVERGNRFTVNVDGADLIAHDGETVLAVLWAAGIRGLRRTARSHEARGFFCGMGICFDCLITVDGRHNVRACMEPVREGMVISRQQDAGSFVPAASDV